MDSVDTEVTRAVLKLNFNTGDLTDQRVQKRLQALKSLLKCSIEDDIESAFTKSLHKSVLKCISDSSEDCRQYSILVIQRFFDNLDLKDKSSIALTILSTILPRISIERKDTQEQSEEVRMDLLKLLFSILKELPEQTASTQSTSVITALGVAASDRNPDAKILVAEIVIFLSSSPFFSVAKPKVATACTLLFQNLSLNFGAKIDVRTFSIRAVGALLLAPFANHSVETVNSIFSQLAERFYREEIPSVRSTIISVVQKLSWSPDATEAAMKFIEEGIFSILVAGLADEDVSVASAAAEGIHEAACRAAAVAKARAVHRAAVSIWDELEARADESEVRRSENSELLVAQKAEETARANIRAAANGPFPEFGSDESSAQVVIKSTPLINMLKSSGAFLYTKFEQVEDDPLSIEEPAPAEPPKFAPERVASRFVLDWASRLLPRVIPSFLVEMSDWTAIKRQYAARSLRVLLSFLVIDAVSPVPRCSDSPFTPVEAENPSPSLSVCLSGATLPLLPSLIDGLLSHARSSDADAAVVADIAKMIGFTLPISAVLPYIAKALNASLVRAPQAADEKELKLRTIRGEDQHPSKIAGEAVRAANNAVNNKKATANVGGGSNTSNLAVDTVKAKAVAWSTLALVLRGVRVGIEETLAVANTRQYETIFGRSSLPVRWIASTVTLIAEECEDEVTLPSDKSSGSPAQGAALTITECIRIVDQVEILKSFKERIFAFLLLLKSEIHESDTLAFVSLAIDELAKRFGISASSLASQQLPFYFSEALDGDATPYILQDVITQSQDIDPQAVVEAKEIVAQQLRRARQLQLLVSASYEEIIPFLNEMVDLFESHSSHQHDPKVRLEFLLVIAELTSKATRNESYEGGGELTALITGLRNVAARLIDNVIVPNLQWRARTANAVLRRTAAVCLNAFLSMHLIRPCTMQIFIALENNPQILRSIKQNESKILTRILREEGGVTPALRSAALAISSGSETDISLGEVCSWLAGALPSIKSMMTDYEEKNRFQAVLTSGVMARTVHAACVSNVVSGFPLSIDQDLAVKELMRGIHEGLVATLDDSSNELRAQACKSLCDTYEALIAMGGSPPFDLESALQAVFIHLDDPAESVANAVGIALSAAQNLDQVKFRQVGQVELGRSQHPGRVNALLNHTDDDESMSSA